MQLCFDHEFIVETPGVYASSINGKVERDLQTIINIVCIQLLSCGHRKYLWYLFYQYTVRIIYCLINRDLGKYPIIDWYKHNNISYIIPFSDLVIWGCKIYTTNYKTGKKELEPRTNIDTCSWPTATYPYRIPPNKYVLLIGYCNYTKVII